MPEFWEIRTCGAHGAVYDMGCKKANIYYNKLQNVQHVEWLMEDGWIYRIDYYNKYALRYASEFLDTDGKTESKVFYSHRNQEVIVEQPQSGAITLLNEGKIKALFTSREELIEYFFYRSFFYRNRLGGKPGVVCTRSGRTQIITAAMGRKMHVGERLVLQQRVNESVY